MITGVYIVMMIGIIMIRKNNIYVYKYFCDIEMKDIQVLALSLEDESKISYNNYSFDSFFYDMIDVLIGKVIKGVMIDDLYDV